MFVYRRVILGVLCPPPKSSGWSWVGVVFFDPCKKEPFKLGEYEIQTGGVKAICFQGLARLSNRGIFNVERFPVVGLSGSTGSNIPAMSMV